VDNSFLLLYGTKKLTAAKVMFFVKREK